MSDILPFLRDLSRRPFAFGGHKGGSDCLLVLADFWLWAGHNSDPAESIRYTYSTDEECQRLLRREGGALRLVARMARDVGARRVQPDAYGPGTGAVVRYRGPTGRETHYGAVWAAPAMWAIKCSPGLVITSKCRVVAAWSV